MASSCEDSDEEFIVLGTAVPDISEGEPLKKPTNIQDLTARDKEGRRRFHGAFTGGFSAGYFNTVGTKEGFTPSTFISSRVSKNEGGQTARPEDFMDDEDLEEHGIAPRKFATVSNFTSEERKRKRHEDVMHITAGSSLDLGSSMADLIVPDRVPVGIKLLCKMGWREGQGLGPRIKKKKKKKKNSMLAKGAKVYGCALPPSGSDESDSDDYIPEDLSEVTFAPHDVCPISLEAKDNIHGLGYRGLDPRLALPGSHIKLFDKGPKKQRKGKGITGQAFGVGAFEDEDADIYTEEDMSQYNIAIDSGMSKDDNFGWTAPREHGKQNLPVSYVGKLLEGFCLSSKQLKPQKKFPPPTLPRHFRPQHWFRKKRITSHIPEDANSESSSHASRLTAVERGLMLGETPIMSSVFDLIPNQDKNRIEATKEAIDINASLTMSKESRLVPTKDEVESGGHTESTPSNRGSFLSKFRPAEAVTPGPTSNSSEQSSHTSKASLFQGGLNFQPFRKDPLKQERYDKYLALVKQGVKDPYLSVISSNMTEWERSREREEFSKASKVFRPLSAMMSSRFVQGSMIDDENADKPLAGENEESDQSKAVDMKMFGKLTREEMEWHPDTLLCRRFNVPNPYPGSDIVGLTTVKRDKYSVFNFLTMGDFQPSETQEPPAAPAAIQLPSTQESGEHVSSSGFLKKKPSLASVFKVLDDPNFHKSNVPSGLKKEEEEPIETLNVTTNTELGESGEKVEEDAATDMDLFRAIFKNSDSEMSDDSSGEENADNDKKEDSEQETYSHKNSTDNSTLNSETNMPLSHEPHIEVLSTQTPVKERIPIQAQLGQVDCSGNPFSSVQRDPALRSRQGKSRWDGKSVFSVLDKMESEDQKEITSNLESRLPTSSSMEEEENMYGPPLPPTHSATPVSLRAAVPPVVDKEKQRRELFYKETKRKKHKQKHKKEKKKRTKHKKDKKHKKHKKSSKSDRGKHNESSSEPDTESTGDSSDLSDTELMKRVRAVSKSGLDIELIQKKL